MRLKLNFRRGGTENDLGSEASNRLVVLGVNVGKDGVFALFLSSTKFTFD